MKTAISICRLLTIVFLANMFIGCSVSLTDQNGPNANLQTCRTTKDKLVFIKTHLLDGKATWFADATFQRESNIWNVARLGDVGFRNPNIADNFVGIENPNYADVRMQLKAFPPIRSMVLRERTWLPLKETLTHIERAQVYAWASACANGQYIQYNENDVEQNEIEALSFLSKNMQLRGLSISVQNAKSIKYIKLMTNLEELEIGNNSYSIAQNATRITDQNLTQLITLKNLRKLTIGHSGTTWKSVRVLNKFPHLESLSVYWSTNNVGSSQLGQNNLEKCIDLSSLKNLRTLAIGGFYCENGSSQNVLLPPKLEEIYLSVDASKKMTFPEWLRKVPSIKIHLRSEFGEWKTNACESLKSLSNRLAVTTGHFQGDWSPLLTLLDGIDSMHTLEILCGCPIRIKQGLEHLARFTQLENLTLVTGCDVGVDMGDEESFIAGQGNADIRVLQDLVNLQKLKLGRLNTENEKRLTFLRKLKELRTLDVTLHDKDSGISFEQVVDVLQDLNNFEELSIHSAVINDAGLMNLIKLKKLRRLDLTECGGYTDEGLAKLMDESPSLQTVIRSYGPEKKGE